MKHRTLPRFWQHYRQLPKEARELADKNFDLLKSDPYHPSLHFKEAPEICRFFGISIKMFFGDHVPPHFHAKKKNQPLHRIEPLK